MTADISPTSRRQWFAGLSWKGPAILVAVCVTNALRRNVNSRLLREDVVEWLIDVGDTTFTGLIIAVLVVGAVVTTVNRLPWRGASLYAATLAAVSVACALGVVLLLGYETDWTYTEEVSAGHFMRAGALFIASWPRYLVFSWLFAIVYLYLRQRREAEREMRRLDFERAQFEQRTTEATVQRLQAQIEPHFLFNTLAHVKRLYETDALAGRSMLENLMRYLSEALPQMRESRSTVEREMALAESYLRIQQIRMGRRLEFRLEKEDAIASAELPPMMLLTLVENAIKHGLSPLPEGGAIVVRAARASGQLALSVIDNGKGFTSDAGSGTGLANIRARLAALYGEAARLNLSACQPRGVAATLVLPILIPDRRSAGR